MRFAVQEVRNDADVADLSELAIRVALRLSDTAVTPSDCSIENATISEYERSAPSSVMSVPCSVVMTCGTDPPFVAARIWRAR